MTENTNVEKILIVDDSKINRAILNDMLSDRYEILEAENGLIAINIIRKYETKISLVLLDVVMPEMDGFEVLTIMNKEHWIDEIPVIMISAENSHSVIKRAYELGATDYINRPFDELIVKQRVINSIMLYAKQKNLTSLIYDQVYEAEKNNTLMVSILSHIVEFRNGESGLHVLHIGTMTEMLLKALKEKCDKYNLTYNDISLISKASAFHDIGKISIPENILNKPARLNKEEFEIIKTHSAIGANMLENLPFHENNKLVKLAYEICRWHHERYDGNGYPDHLKGDEIPISAQVVSIADAYDALISERAYKKAYSHKDALNMILNGECGTYNPILLECLKDISANIEEELKIKSIFGKSDNNVKELTKELTNKKSYIPSSRILKILEEERIKLQFFTSISNEIQFEYSRYPYMITICDKGAKKLNLPNVILNPKENKDFLKILKIEDFNYIDNLLSNVSKDDPISEFNIELFIDNKWQVKQLICRTMWNDDGEFNGCIGKIVMPESEISEIIRLKKSNNKDILTNLYNAKYAKDEITNLLNIYPNQEFIMMIIDLKHFKLLNIKRGHVFGDHILKCIAEKLKEEKISEDDIVARIGGDEFLVFTKKTKEKEMFFENIFKSLIGDYDGFKLDISMGIACTECVDREFDDIYHAADIALYDAKLKDGSNYSCFKKAKEINDIPSNISKIDK